MSEDKRDPWLTEKEAAKELRVSVYAVRKEREEGKLGFAASVAACSTPCP